MNYNPADAKIRDRPDIGYLKIDKQNIAYS